jgi:pimeloyl-ACP methyl ester carboxylesterase
VSTVGFGAVRDGVSPAVALFLGDVFTYLKAGDLRTAIQATVRADVLAAHEASKASGAPLVLIGHSLGGVILTDMLESPAESGLPDDLKVSALITVGSQPGLFQSVGVLAPGAPAGERRPGPRSVANWYNVFDPIDPLAFRADPIFSGVEDHSFNSITGLASAHTTYLGLLAQRIGEAVLDRNTDSVCKPRRAALRHRGTDDLFWNSYRAHYGKELLGSGADLPGV